jgi:hypothetical protein
MRQLYTRGWNIVWHTGDSKYVFSERIDAGWILHVHSAFCYAPERDASDKITLGIHNGGDDIILRAQATLAVQLGMEATNDFFIGEGDQVFAYFADVENNDTIGIHLNGVLIPRIEWESMRE